MKITILTFGSRGDVQPFVPLSLRLMEHGHSVKLAAPLRFKGFIEAHKVNFVSLAGDPEDLSRRMNNAGYDFLRLFRELINHAMEVGAEVWRQTKEACSDADLIVHTFINAVGPHTIARDKNIPDIHIQTFPMFTPTGDYPNVAMPYELPPSLNRFTHRVSAMIAWWTARMGFERVRLRAGLPQRKLYWPFRSDSNRPRTPILCAWSPTILPASQDWPPNVHVTGYFFFPQDESYQPPPALLSFLERGDPPVCITFGSMVNREKEKIDRIMRESLRQTEYRGIILSGWSGIDNRSSNDVLYMEAAPHHWLLPRCKMVIHHGGAGTTAAGLQAGIPNIVLPFMADQPFWGKRVYSIGAGPKPILIKNLSVEKLRRVIAEAEGASICERAQAIGRQIRTEDGVLEAVRRMEDYSNSFHR